MKKLFGIVLVLALVLSFSLVATTPVAAATHNVGPGESIQAAINAASAGDTIMVAAGIYEEFLTVDRSLTLIGPNAGSPGYGPRDDEAVILPPAGAPFVDPYGITEAVLITVHAKNVVIDGFTLRPRNPDAEGENDYQAQTGILGDGRGLVGDYVDVDGLEVRNNIIQGFPAFGVFVSRARGQVSSDGPITDVVVEDNYIKESYDGFGFGFYLQGTIGHVLNNTVAEVLGNQVQPYGAVAAPGEGLVSGNTISARGLSLYHNYDEKGGEWTYSGNTLTPDLDATWWEGIRIQTVYNDPTLIFTDNTIDGQGAVAESFRGLRFLGDVSAAACDNLDFSGNDFEGLYVFVEDDSTGKHVDLDAILTANTFEPVAGIDDNRIIALRVHNETQDTYHATIQEAVDEADPGDTIVVGAGTYDEALTINRSVSLLGAQAGVDARDRTDADESILIDTTDSVLSIAAAGVTVDGFTIVHYDGYTHPGGARDRIGLAPGSDNVTVRNNILGRRIFPGSDVSDLTISQNWFKDVQATGTTSAIYHENAATNLEIVDNKFTDIAYSVVILVDVGPQGHDNTTISRNEMRRTGSQAINIAGPSQKNLTIEDNVIEAAGLDFTPDTYRGAIRLYSGFPYENVSIQRNELRDSLSGITVRSGALDWTDVTIAWNSIVGNDVGLWNESGTEVDATYNWWGHASGPTHPSNTLGTGDVVSDNVLFDPWIGKTVGVETDPETGTASFTPSWGVIEDLQAVPAVSPAPRGVSFPHGMFEFKITGLTPGETVTLTIELPEAVPVGTVWWKHDGTSWYSLPNLADTGDNIMVIQLTDGGPGDTPGSPAGEIHDPGGPGNPVPPLTVGWEGSSVNKAAVMAPWIALLAMMMAGATLLVGRRRRAQT